MKVFPRFIVASLFALGSWNAEAFGQVECTPEGNLRGIRVQGELMAFRTSIRAVVSDAGDGQGGRGRGSGGQFSRKDGALIATGSLSGDTGRGGGPPPAGASYRAVFKDVAPGAVAVEIEISSTTNTPMQGVYFVTALPGGDYAAGSAQWIAPISTANAPISLAAARASGGNPMGRASAKGVRLVSPQRQIEIQLLIPAELVIREVRNRGKNDIEVSFPLSLGDLASGQTVRTAFTIKATGEADKSPARLVIDPARPGRKYAGMGGNFRIQSPGDAAHVQYNLDHLRVAWGRVAMPLDRWQPNEDVDPREAAAQSRLNGSVREAMEMAQKLARKDIPTIASIWSAPSWALAAGGGGRGGRTRINPDKWDNVCKSIGSYLEYMKRNYGPRRLRSASGQQWGRANGHRFRAAGGRERGACAGDRQSSRHAGDWADARRPRLGASAAGQHEFHDLGRDSVRKLGPR
jgi:hypothetical protein